MHLHVTPLHNPKCINHNVNVHVTVHMNWISTQNVLQNPDACCITLLVMIYVLSFRSPKGHDLFVMPPVCNQHATSSPMDP